MKPLLLGIVVVASVVVALPTEKGSYLQKTSTVKQTSKRLDVSITTDRKKYRLREKLEITVKLNNPDYVKEVSVYGQLGWGYYSSLNYTIRDKTGKPVQPTVLLDDMVPPPKRDDSSLFVKLNPDHFLGTHYAERLARLGLKRPGRYSLVVQYHSPISKSAVDIVNFWSKEDGTIDSNTIYFEVLP
jgi:hypothetical protein